MDAEHAINVDVWIDYACPYSWMHLPTLDLFRLVYGSRVEVRWHPFEMRPEPVPLPEPDSEARRDKWRNVFYPLALERGVTLHMPQETVRSRLAFETAAWACDQGRFDAVNRALFEAYFVHGENIGDIETLVRIAARSGDEADELRHALEIGWYAIRVERHKALAARLGVDGTPFTLVSRADEASGRTFAPVVLRGVAPLSHFHAAVKRLFPEGFVATSAISATSEGADEHDVRSVHAVVATTSTGIVAAAEDIGGSAGVNMFLEEALR